MTEDITLTKDTYEVLKRVPADWWNEDEVKLEIGVALGMPPSRVTKRLAHLLQLRLVEKRRRPTITPTMEIRRVGK
jgi:RIO-like serine/threonine protein kinase